MQESAKILIHEMYISVNVEMVDVLVMEISMVLLKFEGRKLHYLPDKGSTMRFSSAHTPTHNSCNSEAFLTFYMHMYMYIALDFHPALLYHKPHLPPSNKLAIY